MPNRGGFSWKRALGVTREKQRIARKTGIPFTKSGRERKIGRAVTGGCAILPAMFVLALSLTATTVAATRSRRPTGSQKPTGRSRA